MVFRVMDGPREIRDLIGGREGGREGGIVARVSHLANLAGQLEEHGVPRTWLASMRLLPPLWDGCLGHA